VPFWHLQAVLHSVQDKFKQKDLLFQEQQNIGSMERLICGKYGYRETVYILEGCLLIPYGVLNHSEI